MHFCDKCENRLYIKLVHKDSNDLVYYCRNCGETEQLITKENICVSKTDIVIKETAYLHDINEYTKLDPTLPRTNNIRCPNPTCASNVEGDDSTKSEVIYYRYNDKDLRYIYICTLCDKMWKTSEQ